MHYVNYNYIINFILYAHMHEWFNYIFCARPLTSVRGFFNAKFYLKEEGDYGIYNNIKRPL